MGVLFKLALMYVLLITTNGTGVPSDAQVADPTVASGSVPTITTISVTTVGPVTVSGVTSEVQSDATGASQPVTTVGSQSGITSSSTRDILSTLATPASGSTTTPSLSTIITSSSTSDILSTLATPASGSTTIPSLSIILTSAVSITSTPVPGATVISEPAIPITSTMPPSGTTAQATTEVSGITATTIMPGTSIAPGLTTAASITTTVPVIIEATSPSTVLMTSAPAVTVGQSTTATPLVTEVPASETIATSGDTTGTVTDIGVETGESTSNPTVAGTTAEPDGPDTGTTAEPDGPGTETTADLGSDTDGNPPGRRDELGPDVWAPVMEDFKPGSGYFSGGSEPVRSRAGDTVIIPPILAFTAEELSLMAGPVGFLQTSQCDFSALETCSTCDWTECRDRCHSNEACARFIFTESSCQLESKSCSSRTDTAATQTYNKVSYEYRQRDGNCPGHFMRDPNSTAVDARFGCRVCSEYDCRRLCDSQLFCFGFSYAAELSKENWHANKQCYLKWTDCERTIQGTHTFFRKMPAVV